MRASGGPGYVLAWADALPFAGGVFGAVTMAMAMVPHHVQAERALAEAGTWAEARRTAQRALPGCTYRRLAMWRYLVEWRKPSEQ